jgi:methionyl-tRNA formyltransferase
VLGENDPPALLVLDPSSDEALDREIVFSSGVDPAAVVRSSDPALLADALAAHRIDLGILAWWPRILKAQTIHAAKAGFLNLHPSLLPFNRGKDYNFWAIVERAPFGVTIHWVTPGVDDGPIAFQRSIDLTWEDTGATTYAKAQDAIVGLFRDSWGDIRTGAIPRIDQSSDTGSFHRRAELEPASEIKLDGTYSGRDLLNLLRARTFPPHPGAWFIDDGDFFEVRVSITRSKERPF